MATVIGKRRADGRVYYYLVESARVDGKPRIVSQQYLGSAEEIAEKLTGGSAGAPVRSQHKRFGDLAAVWSVLERLGVVEVIDAGRAPPGGRGRVGGHLPGVGDGEPGRGPVLEARLRRLVGHHRRAALGEAGRPARWITAGSGTRWTGSSEADLAAIETQLGRRMVAEFGLDLSGSGAGHDQLRHLHRLRQRQGADRPAGQGQAETRRPAAGRPGPGRHPRRRDPAGVARLPRRPARRHPVHRRDRRTGRPLPADLAARRCRVVDAWSTTPGRTRPTTTRWSKRPGSGSSGRCRPATTPTCWPSPEPATAPWTPTGSRA